MASGPMKALHERFFRRSLSILPSTFETYDSQRLVMAYFCISGLDLLNPTELFTAERKSELIAWIYSLQFINYKHKVSGFESSKCFGNPAFNHYRHGLVAMTYVAIASLLVLGDDLSGINRVEVLASLSKLQLADGSFASHVGGEADMRMVYCAACICFMLDDWSGMDPNLTIQFVTNSMTYECAFGQGAQLESHAGSTYCAIATLALLDRLDVLNERHLKHLLRWLVFRQREGFTGRPNKIQDTCYSYWVGATLSILKSFQLTNYNENAAFLNSTQNMIVGGLSKWPDTQPEPLHTYLGLAGWSLLPIDHGLNAVEPKLNISQRAYQHLLKLHNKWRHKF